MTTRRADAHDALVGQNIRANRLARGMSQSDLADAIGVTFQQVQKYEKGTNRVGASRLVRVANALEVQATTLLSGIPGLDERNPPSPISLLTTTQRLRMARAFASIKDRSVRLALVTLAESMGEAPTTRRAARIGRRARSVPGIAPR